MSRRWPSVEELIPTEITYGSVKTEGHQDMFVVNLDTQKVMDGVQSVSVNEGVAHCLIEGATIPIPVLGRFQIYIRSDCEHGFVVRDIQENYRFHCKECNTRFRAYPIIGRVRLCL